MPLRSALSGRLNGLSSLWSECAPGSTLWYMVVICAVYCGASGVRSLQVAWQQWDQNSFCWGDGSCMYRLSLSCRYSSCTQPGRQCKQSLLCFVGSRHDLAVAVAGVLMGSAEVYMPESCSLRHKTSALPSGSVQGLTHARGLAELLLAVLVHARLESSAVSLGALTQAPQAGYQH